MNAKVILVFALAVYVPSREVSGALGTATAIMQGVDSALGVVQTIDNLIIKPILATVEKDVKDIDTAIEGISENERKLVAEALKFLQMAENHIRGVRAELSVFADEVIERSIFMRTILTKTLEKTGKSQEYGVKLMAKKMKSMVERINKYLLNALAVYRQVNSNCNLAQFKLTHFAEEIDKITDTRSAAHEKLVKKVRAEAYGAASIGWAYLGPVGAAWSYAAAAVIVEPKIKAWKEKLAKLRVKAAHSKQVCVETAKKAAEAFKNLGEEERIVQNWYMQQNSVYDDIANTTNYIAFLQIDDDIKHEQIGKLTKLIETCQQFKNHIAATPF